MCHQPLKNALSPTNIHGYLRLGNHLCALKLRKHSLPSRLEAWSVLGHESFIHRQPVAGLQRERMRFHCHSKNNLVRAKTYSSDGNETKKNAFEQESSSLSSYYHIYLRFLQPNLSLCSPTNAISRILEPATQQSQRSDLEAVTNVGSDWNLRHVFDSCGDDDVLHTTHDRLHGKVDGLL